MGYNVYGAAMLAFTINLTFIYMASMLYDRTTCKALCKAATVLAEVDNPCPPGFPGPHLSADQPGSGCKPQSPWVTRGMHWV